ncbi:MAG: hypothetical protein APG12_00610 [Candidatus Methanofastidiosum methylothiophilum]|uniref:PrcB C-terminal domain-containing protein n=1 Tax=Candidatus Methanofastidiosum methylothiophilum TaxID=1705564 RepID=A0A150ILU9_9EURY|nr:MAG: hypothetical protein APG10_00559 [Candidatus Methanofastidiosum methylthiophilus]KYC48008.1 MAG: hypothetical protein APG11_00678 [Candidatus Methanofastidiosum methylthiophilus]KYC50698.1 MAG: hypothetical protein APG12_00610 [Candidatus Methanofastidiosum methylthiophilus]
MKRDIKIFGSYLICLLAISILAGCVNQAPKEIVFQEIENGYYSGLIEKNNYIINNESEWQSFWNKFNKNNLETQAISIDFTKYTVIAVAMGEKNTGGYSIKIKKVLEYSDKVEVIIEEKPPSKEDMVTMALTQPYDIVYIPKTSKSILFRN